MTVCLCLPQADAGHRLPDAGVSGDGVFVCVRVFVRPMPDIDCLMQECPVDGVFVFVSGRCRT